MKINTITTIELSSICNLKCKYCINRLMRKNGRMPRIMSDVVFDKSLYWLSQLIERGTQKEVNLNGNGESLLDPQFIKRAKAVKDVMGKGTVMLSTNGTLVTDAMAKAIKEESGINRIDLSLHDAYAARKAVDLFFKYQIYGQLNTGPILSTHSWAGQLESEHTIPFKGKIKCDPLIEGRAYIDSDGDVVPCCYDYLKKGKIGNVFDEHLLDRECRPFSLCDTCHQEIPEGVRT